MSCDNGKCLFALNKDRYYNECEEIFKKYFTPRTIIQFPIMLPFHFPVQNNGFITIKVNEQVLANLHFSTITTTESVCVGVLTEKPMTVPVKITRVEMNYVTTEKISWPSEEDVEFSKYFYVLVGELNHILLAYLIVKKDVDAYRITKEMTEFACLFRLVDVDSWSQQDGLLHLHIDVPFVRNDLSHEELRHLIHYSTVIKKDVNPFIVSEELALTANRYFKEGFYRETVIFAQMSVETFINNLYNTLLQSEGKTAEEADSSREEIAFLTVVKREIHCRLGGYWDIKCKDSVVGQWYVETYQLRNAVVHKGHVPSYSESDLALFSANNLRGYMVGLIKKNKKKYPLVYQYFVTDEGTSE